MSRSKHVRLGFTLVETVVSLIVATTATSALVIGVSGGQDDNKLTKSIGNLRNLAVANDTYAADWADRQFTACPDDVGLVAGQGVAYGQQIGCMGQQLIGYDAGENLWGWWCAGGICGPGYPGDEAHWTRCFSRVFVPMDFSLASMGSFRMPSVKGFNSYVGGRWYDPLFWAPKDSVPLGLAETMFGSKAEFGFTQRALPGTWDDIPVLGGIGGIALPSYVWSPAAMYHPEVWSRCGFRDPFGSNFPAGFKSPSVGQCKFPSLKTRMIEHHWLQNAPSQTSSFKHEGDASWLFSQGLGSSPATLFFDGRVEVVSVGQAIIADTVVRGMLEENVVLGRVDPGAECGRSLQDVQTGLWNRGSPLGLGGYFGNESIGDVSTGMHVLTTDGIRGRDLIDLEAQQP